VRCSKTTASSTLFCQQDACDRRSRLLRAMFASSHGSSILSVILVFCAPFNFGFRDLDLVPPDGVPRSMIFSTSGGRPQLSADLRAVRMATMNAD
jgi:hypothetical protein